MILYCPRCDYQVAWAGHCEPGHEPQHKCGKRLLVVSGQQTVTMLVKAGSVIGVYASLEIAIRTVDLKYKGRWTTPVTFQCDDRKVIVVMRMTLHQFAEGID